MKKILFLDDDKTLCTLLELLMAELGASDTTFAHSYAEFIQLEKDIHQFDIIFLDVNLGSHVPSGLDAFDWLKEKKFDKKVIFFTGHASSYPVVQKALTYPNVFILEKPVVVQKIEEMIIG